MNFWEVFGCGMFIGVFVGIWVAYLLNMVGEKRRSKIKNNYRGWRLNK